MVAKTFRLDDELVARFVARAGQLGQSQTVFVARALERALGGGDPVAWPLEQAQGGPPTPASVRAAGPPAPSMAPEPLRKESVVERNIRLADERRAQMVDAAMRKLG